MSAAKRVAHAAETVRARWERDIMTDPQTDAAQALEDSCQLLDPEVAEELRRLRAEAPALRARVAGLEAAHADAVDVSETLSRALHEEMLAGSALYAALTMPTTPEERQAALDRFTAVAQRIGQVHAPSVADGITRRIAPTQVLREDVYESPLHQDHRTPHDLPETGGAR